MRASNADVEENRSSIVPALAGAGATELSMSIHAPNARFSHILGRAAQKITRRATISGKTALAERWPGFFSWRR
jgi:hypothetical protein